MKKTKIEQRVENAVNAFFDDESFAENKLGFVNDSALLKQETHANFSEKADVCVKIIKQIFLFFPGTFVLFNLSLILAVFILSPPLNTFVLYPGKLTIALLVSAFMTMFGLGNVKNAKHLIIPASIVLFAFVSGSLIALFGGGGMNFNFLDIYAMYLLPLALIVPILAKGWADRRGQNQTAFDKF